MAKRSSSSGVELIAAERRRQLRSYTLVDDAQHAGGELAMAAACAASPDPIYVMETFANSVEFNDPWPWLGQYCDFRPHDGNVLDRSRQTRLERIRELAKAGALVAAEIDRLSRVTNAEWKGK